MTLAVIDLEKTLQIVCYIDKEDFCKVNEQVEKIKMLITEMKWED